MTGRRRKTTHGQIHGYCELLELWR